MPKASSVVFCRSARFNPFTKTAKVLQASLACSLKACWIHWLFWLYHSLVVGSLKVTTEDNNNYKVFDLKSRRIIWSKDIKVLEGQFLKEKQIKHVSFQEEVEEIETEGFDITDTPYNNNLNNPNNNNLNNQNNNNSNNNNLNNSNNNNLNNSNNNNSNNLNNNNNLNTRIITRSQTRRINSSQDIALSPPQVVVEIPRKNDEYYNQY